MVSAGHHPRLTLRPLGDNRDDGRHVEAGSRVRPIAFRYSGAIIGADVKEIGGVPVYASPAGKDLGKAGVVVAVKKVF